MIRRITLVALLLQCLAYHAWAQRPVKGFVVTTTGDTIYGELYQSERDARQQIIHLKPTDGDAVTYSATTIKSTGRKGYASVESRTYGSNHTPILAEPVIKGPLTLYKSYEETGQDPRVSPDIRYFLQFPDSTDLAQIDPGNLTLSLTKLLGDCSTMNVVERLTNHPKSYNSTQLSRFVKDYTSCRFKSTTYKAKPYKGWYTSWGIKAGLNQGQLKAPETFINLGGVDFTRTNSWQAGIFANLAYWNGFSVQAEADLVQFKGDHIRPVYSGTSLYSITRTAHLELQLVRVPVMLRYQIGHGLIRPYLMAGPHIGYNISHSAFIRDQRSDQATTSERLVVWPDKFASGLQGGVGIYVALPNLPGISLESMYTKGQLGLNLRQLNHLSFQDIAFTTSMYF